MDFCHYRLDVSTSMFDGGDGILGVIGAAFLLLQTWRVELMLKSWILVSSDHNTFTQFSSESLANFRRACICAFLSRGPCGRCRISVLHGVECATNCFLVVPAALRSLILNPRWRRGWQPCCVLRENFAVFRICFICFFVVLRVRCC